MTKLINIGFGNLVNAQKIVAIVSPDAAPIKRLVQSAKNDGRVIDATQGRFCRPCSRIPFRGVLVASQNWRREERVMNKGVLTVVSGFSGSGKGTIMKALLKKYDNYALSISATTRSPREGERNGREYFFKTKEEFQRLIEEDQLIEYAQYVENYYGTPREYVERCLDDGKDVILEIEVQGARKVKEKIPEAVLIFVTPPSAEELRARLVGRGTESMEVIESRLSRANEEAVVMPDYDYLLVNDDLEQCVEAMHGIIQAERCKMRRNETFQRKIKEELKEFLKGEEV